MGYIDRIAQPNVVIPIGTIPPVGGVSNRRQNVARVRVEDGEAQSWRVVMAPIIFSEPFPGAIIDVTSGIPNKPQAIVTFGVDGVYQEVRVDWPAGGGMFSVWGDSVVVDCQIPDTWITSLPPAQVSVSGAVVPDATAGSLRPSKSAYTGLVTNGNFSAPIPVPNGAKSFRWHQAINLSVGNVAIPITWYGTIDAGIAAPTQTTPAGTYTTAERTWPGPDGIPLLPDTRFLVFQNNGAAGQDCSMTIEFVMDLG